VTGRGAPNPARDQSRTQKLIKEASYAQDVANELDAIRDRLRAFAAARSWGTGHSPRNLALALVGEVGELAAELQWVPDHMIDSHLADPSAKARLADEVADVFIYLLQFADKCGIDLVLASYAKIDRNELRYPACRASVMTRRSTIPGPPLRPYGN
jgi:dCTP diphosphatase